MMKQLQRVVWVMFASLLLVACGQETLEPPVQPPEEIATQPAVMPPSFATVKSGDTLIGLFGNNWQQVCQFNKLADCDLLKPGQQLMLPAGIQVAPQPPTMTYTIIAGDTLWGIVGKNWPKVCRENQIRNCDLILPGQVIEVPVPMLSPGRRSALNITKPINGRGGWKTAPPLSGDRS